MKNLIVIILFCGHFAIGQTTNFSNGVELSFLSSTILGQSSAWYITITNKTNTTHQYSYALHVNKIYYTGDEINTLVSFATTNSLPANSTTNIVMSISPSIYLPWEFDGNCFEFSAFMETGNEQWHYFTRSNLTFPDSILTKLPSSPIPVGGSVTGIVSFLNPLPLPLHNARVLFIGVNGFSEGGPLEEAEISLGTVASNAVISATHPFIARCSGTNVISATFSSDELTGISDELGVIVTQ